MLRRLLTLAMFRQALAASEACTPDRGAMNAANRLGRRVFLLAAGVVQHELIRGERDRLAHGLGRKPFGERQGDRLGGLLPGSRRRSCG